MLGIDSLIYAQAVIVLLVATSLVISRCRLHEPSVEANRNSKENSDYDSPMVPKVHDP